MNPDRLEAAICIVLESKFQGTAGQSDGTHVVDESRDGGGGRHRRQIVDVRGLETAQ
jgi:hypothetical protein